MTEFKTTQEDSAYACANTDGQNPYQNTRWQRCLHFSIDSLVRAKSLDRFSTAGVYKVVKVSKIFYRHGFKRTRKAYPYQVDRHQRKLPKQTAKEKAQGILRDIEAGADFGAKAREFGTDGTASSGGDLGWFSTGQMVKPFENAVFGATRPGLLNEVVETEFGYHIIEVTNVKNNTAYQACDC